MLIAQEQAIMKVKQTQLSHFQGPQMKRKTAAELVTAANVNLDKPQGLGKALKEFQKGLVGE